MFNIIVFKVPVKILPKLIILDKIKFMMSGQITVTVFGSMIHKEDVKVKLYYI